MATAARTNLRFGGSMSQILRNIIENIRRRATVERELRAGTTEIRSSRYALLRGVLRQDLLPALDEIEDQRDQTRAVVLPPGAWAVGRELEDVRGAGAAVSFTGLRRRGILGRDPVPEALLRDGDIVVVSGAPDAIEHAETILLSGGGRRLRGLA